MSSFATIHIQGIASCSTYSTKNTRLEINKKWFEEDCVAEHEWLWQDNLRILFCIGL